MPRKSVTKKTTRKPVKKEKQNFFSWLKLSESYTSLFLGALVIVVAAFIGVSVLKNSNVNNTKQEVSSTSTVASVTPEKYTVKKGDSLWSISEKIYKSGYNWIDIAKTNNIANVGVIEEGQVLLIPDVKPIIVDIEKEIPPQAITTQAEGAIFGNTYTVVRGDNLWDIAVRAYGDGYRWVDVAKANNLANPDLIFSGNVFKMPR